VRIVRFRDLEVLQYTDSPKSVYLYRVRETSELVGVEMAFGEKMSRERPGGFLTLPDGAEAIRAMTEELAQDGIKMGPKPKIGNRARWPMVSVNAGINPDQIDELRAHWKEHNVTGCDVNAEGDVIWDSPAARKRDCESRGLYDRDGGYSDPQGKNV
jgi:hypothetical protein